MTRAAGPVPLGRDLAALLVLAGAILVAAGARSVPLLVDSCAYIELARSLASGQLTALHAHDYPPLYSLLIAATYPACGDWLLAAQLVAGAMTALGVVPLYLIGRAVAPREVAATAGALYAVHPLFVEWGAAAVSDGPYLMLWSSGLALAVQAGRFGRAADYALAGLATGLAFLVRPEGLELAVVLVVAACSGAGAWRARAAGLLAAAAVALAVAGPYVWLLSDAAGFPVLSRKKAILQLPSWRFGPGRPMPLVSALTPELDPPRPLVADDEVRRRWIAAEVLALEYQRQARARGLIPAEGELWPVPGDPRRQIGWSHITDPSEPVPPRGRFVAEFSEKFHPVLLALLVGCLAVMAWRRSRPSRAQCWVAVAFVLHLVLVLDNNRRHGYLSERHLMPLAQLGLLPAAAALVALDARLAALRPGWRGVKRPGWAALLVLLVLGLDSLRPRGHDKDYLPQIAQALREQDPYGLGIDGVIGREPRLAYHAGAVHEAFDPWRGYREVVRQLVQHQCRYLALPEDERYRVEPLVRLGWLRPVIVPGLDPPPRAPLHVYRAEFVRPISH